MRSIKLSGKNLILRSKRRKKSILETKQLLSTKMNRKRLMESIMQMNNEIYVFKIDKL